MKIFNAIQLTAITALGPMLLALLNEADFNYSRPLFWVGSIVYLGVFVWNIIAFVDHLESQ